MKTKIQFLSNPSSKTLDPYILFPAGPLTWSPIGNSNWKGRGNLSSSTPSPLPTPSLSPWMHHPSPKPQILLHPLRYPPWHSSFESPLLPFHSYSLSWVSPRQTLAITCLLFCLIWPPAHQSILPLLWEWLLHDISMFLLCLNLPMTRG